MPSLWHWHLAAPPEACRQHHLHAVVSRLISHEDPRPFALSPPEAFEGATRVEVRLLDDDPEFVSRVVERFQDTLREGVTLGADRVAVFAPVAGAGISLLRAHPWATLLSEALPISEFELEFMSPCYVRRGRRQVPLPLAGSVARSALRSWSQFAASTAPQFRFDDADVDVCALDGQSLTVTLSSRSHHGFVGRISYSIGAREPSVRSTMHALAMAAAYTGVGSSTAYGFGTVELVRAE